MNKIEFDKLLGEKASLYYNNEVNKFQLGSVIFEVIEDESDGYRSYLQEVDIVDTKAARGQLLGEIEIKQSGIIDAGFDLVDNTDGFIWLTFGTDNSDDYYPCFVFRKNARPPIEETIRQLIK